ncbi:MAG TPA: glycoside hydrolase domain-containing protein, partial [Planctomycetota bacterium]|nr:glycoside hydrolase domain-containing protein [Planctomycetota bacterium]
AAALTAMISADAWAQQGAPPPGVQVWNADILAPYRDFMPPDADGPLAPITIVGTRNGTFSGKVVLGSAGPIEGLRAEMSALECGNAKIPASATQVRYPRYMRYSGWQSVARAVAEFDALEKTPPKEVALITERMKPGYWDIGKVKFDHAWQPIWVTVSVPADAAPGDYRGNLKITVGDAKPFAVPVTLKVSGWRLPDPQDYVTFVEFMQSPESVALRYEVPLWSDQHFKLMEKSLKLLGRIGNRSVYIPLIAETNQGHDETMVRWIKDGEKYRYDFTVMEKYLDAVERNMGRPRNVVLYVWDIFLEGGSFELGDGKNKTDLDFLSEEARQDRMSHRGKGPNVTLLDPPTGKLTRLTLPQYSDPKARALWKPLLDELRARLKKRGLEDAMTLGAACDAVPSKETVAFFTDLLPGTPWMEHTHGFYGGPQRLQAHGATIKYVAIVFFHTIPKTSSRFHEWTEGEPAVVYYPRGRPHNVPITDYRLTAEEYSSGKMRGFGRVGADFWPVLKDKRGRMVGRISQGRFPKSLWRNLDIRQTLLEPGPEGAISTVRFEMMCEGVQENEARLFVERALLSKKISGDLADRCREVLDERAEALKRYRTGAARNKSTTDEAYLEYVASWQERSERLYRLAAEVAKALERE